MLKRIIQSYRNWSEMETIHAFIVQHHNNTD